VASLVVTFRLRSDSRWQPLRSVFARRRASRADEVPSRHFYAKFLRRTAASHADFEKLN
jgi:hypothetical protein